MTLTFFLDIEVSLHSPLARGLLVLICRSNSLHQHFYFLLGAQKVVSCLHLTHTRTKKTHANRSWEPYLSNVTAILKQPFIIDLTDVNLFKTIHDTELPVRDIYSKHALEPKDLFQKISDRN